MAKKMSKKTKKYIIISVVAAVVLIGAIIAVAVLPTKLVESRYDKIFDKMMEMENSTIVVTNMSAESNFSGVASEVIVDGADDVARIVNDLASVAALFEYEGKASASGAWDIRFRVTNGEESVDVYLAKDRMYYIRDDSMYIFKPTVDKAQVDYTKIYNSMNLILQ